MRLQLLVPHWQERPDEVEPLLDSLRMQRNVDLSEVGVIIAFDGPDATDLPLDEWRARYPFDIRDVHPPKGGVSATRNAALDASGAEYVMFCDADDCLCDACGLYVVFREMDATPNPQELAMLGVADDRPGFDMLISVFREETRGPDGNLVYVNHDVTDSTFVHGRVMRREWLVENGIRSCDRLTVHEDSYLMNLCRAVVEPHRAKCCPTPFYLWCWRDASVCRHDPDYVLRTYNDMLDSTDALVDELVRRKMPEKASAYAAMAIFDAYYTMGKPQWADVNHRGYRDATERRFAAFYRKHRDKWDALTQQERVVLSSQIRNRSIGDGMLMEAVTIDQWLEGVSRLA